MNSDLPSPPIYKSRVWVSNTWKKEFHGAPEAKGYAAKGYSCTCIRCLIECTLTQNPLAGPAFFAPGEKENTNLVGLYLLREE